MSPESLGWSLSPRPISLTLPPPYPLLPLYPLLSIPIIDPVPISSSQCPHRFHYPNSCHAFLCLSGCQASPHRHSRPTSPTSGTRAQQCGRALTVESSPLDSPAQS